MMKKITAVILAMAMMVGMGTTVFAEEGKENGSFVALQENHADLISDDFLLQQTGMPQKEIYSLDTDIKAFIVNDLKASGEIEDIAYVAAEDIYTPALRVNQVLAGISFSVQSFKSANNIYIYPTYEFTTDKKPNGNDSFAIQFGDALMPYEYGGQLWYKDYSMSNWAEGGSMIANTQTFNGAEYSGYQLGSPDWSMKIKGCAFAHAEVGSGTDKRIIMSYMYNPKSANYDISFEYNGLGIVYHSSDTIYTAAKTQFLSY